MEDAVAGIEALGHQCDFSAESQPRVAWSCWAQPFGITLSGGETGPLTSIDAYVRKENQPPEALDRVAVASFRALLASVQVPDNLLLSESQMADAVRANRPIQIGEGWTIAFDRSDIFRLLYLRYQEPSE